VEVVEEGESSSRPAKRKEEGRRGPGRPSAPRRRSPLARAWMAFFLRRPSTSLALAGRRIVGASRWLLAADCPVGLVTRAALAHRIGIAHYGIKQPSCCCCCCCCDACCQPNRLPDGLQRNTLLVWRSHGSRGCQDRLDRQALRASAFPTMDSLHTSAPVPQPSQS
jgi:hypothetical protein